MYLGAIPTPATKKTHGESRGFFCYLICLRDAARIRGFYESPAPPRSLFWAVCVEDRVRWVPEGLDALFLWAKERVGITKESHLVAQVGANESKL